MEEIKPCIVVIGGRILGGDKALYRSGVGILGGDKALYRNLVIGGDKASDRT